MGAVVVKGNIPTPLRRIEPHPCSPYPVTSPHLRGLIVTRQTDRPCSKRVDLFVQLELEWNTPRNCDMVPVSPEPRHNGPESLSDCPKSQHFN